MDCCSGIDYTMLYDAFYHYIFCTVLLMKTYHLYRNKRDELKCTLLNSLLYFFQSRYVHYPTYIST